MDEPPVRPRQSRPRAGPPPAPVLGLLSAAIGIAIVVLGYLSATHAERPWVVDPFAGYDPPFEIVAGILLLALAPWIRGRSWVAWGFATLAPVLTASVALLSPDPYSASAAILAAGFVAYLYPYRTGFYRGSSTGPEATQIAFIVASLLAVLFGTVGTKWLGGQFSPPVHSWTEALYYTMAVISTIGATYQPTTDGARLFVVALILIGVGTFLSAVVVLFAPFLESRLARFAARLERAQMRELEQHVIICGAGPEATATGRALKDAGVPHVVLSSEARSVDLLKGEGFEAHLGDPSAEEDLRYVGIDRARALVAALDSDAANLLTIITARSLQPRLRIVAIAAQESTLAKFLRAGANEAISVVSVAARLACAAALQTDPPSAANGSSAVAAPATSA